MDPDAPLTLAPSSGDDTSFEIVDGAVAALGLARGLWMGDDRVMIHLVASIIEQAERLLPYLVMEAREAMGVGWEELAGLLGVAVEEARSRFDPDSPTQDKRLPWNDPTDPGSVEAAPGLQDEVQPAAADRSRRLPVLRSRLRPPAGGPG